MHVPVPSAGVVDVPITEKEAQGQQPHHKVGGLPPGGAGFLLFLCNHILFSLALDGTDPELPHGQWENGEGTDEPERAHGCDSVPGAKQHCLLCPLGAPACYW